MKRSNRLWWLGGIAIAVVVLLTLIAAPNTSYINNGSTYNRAPDGYGAWYAYMQAQGVKIERWQKPFEDLKPKSAVTLLRVNNQLTDFDLDTDEKKWIEKGNTLVILGVKGTVTKADFSTLQSSPVGDVKIETSRRTKKKETILQLGDRFGAIIWSQKVGKGVAIFSTTPYLAANAYQDYPSNFKYLAQLVGKNPQIFVDEYSHGYRDKSITETESDRNLWAYLANTPLLPLLLQAGVLLLILIWAQNRRFGALESLETPAIDNNIAYIQAMAGVLEKAECSEFILSVVGKEEQLQLQKALGLGKIPLEQQTLVDNWVQQTKNSPSQLQQLLHQRSRLSNKQLLEWLDKWQKMRDRPSS
ncbi:DUF4350 domain-containing protein [Synechocystis sp. PCC 7509]|uniref:DUF4350 domain-containing protein n=1 Tax=Synechocystis sp. PCC 7509 TaxID=927677 RepID=UPI0002AC7E8E|nr:DUF4350 domain-containing protein [Synechocystis sp. PCC 7509]